MKSFLMRVTILGLILFSATPWTEAAAADATAAGSFTADGMPSDGAAIPPLHAKKKKPPIEARFYVGYHQESSSGMEDSWIPIHLDITNNTSETLTGTLVCGFDDTRNGVNEVYRLGWSRSVSVGGLGTRKHFRLHIYLPPGSAGVLDTLPVYLETKQHGRIAPTGGTLPVGVLTRSTVLVDQKQGSSTRVRRDALLTLDADVPASISPYPVDHAGVIRTMISGDVFSLPTCWGALAGMRTVVWNGADPAHMEVKQAAALGEYLTMGGHLVLAVGPSGGTLRGTLLEPFLPVTLQGSMMMDVARVVTGTVSANDAVAQATPKPGAEVLIEKNGVPLVVRAKWGAGTVTFCAFSLSSPALRVRMDDAGASLAQRTRFIDAIVNAPSGTLRLLSEPSLRETAEPYLRYAAKRWIPARSFVIAFAAVYILTMVPLLYFIFRGVGRTVWAWGAVPLVAGLFFVFIWNTSSFQTEGKLLINELSFVVLPNQSATGSGITLSNDLSPTGGFFQLDWPNTSTVSVPLRGRERLELLRRIPMTYHDLTYAETDARIVINRFDVDFNDTRLHERARPLTFPGTLGVHVDEDALLQCWMNPEGIAEGPQAIGSVDDRTGLSLKNAVLLLPYMAGVDERNEQRDEGSGVMFAGWRLDETSLQKGQMVVTSPTSVSAETLLNGLCRNVGGVQRLALMNATEKALRTLATEDKMGVVIAEVPKVLDMVRVDGQAARASGQTFILMPFVPPMASRAVFQTVSPEL